MIPADVLVPNGVGIRVITTGDAECWDDETTKDELPGIDKPVLAVLREHDLIRENSNNSELSSITNRSNADFILFSTSSEFISRILNYAQIY